MLLRRAAAPPTARSSARPAAAPGGPRRARASQRSTTPTASAQQQQQQPAPQPPPAAPPSKQPPAAATRAELVSFCWAEVAALRAACAAAESSGEGNGGHRAALAAAHPLHRADAANLAHYLAVRGFELRGLQAALHSLGLSSLGHAESSVAPHLDAVAAALAALAAAERVQLPPPPPGLPKGWPLAAVGAGKVPAADDGAARLRAHARAALGATHHATRLMATLPSEAASDPAVAAGLLDAGMQIARINLAHDGPAEWAAMAAHVRSAASAAGAPCLISVDLAGPKLRVLFPPDELPRKEADDKATEVEPSVEGSTASSSTEEETKGAAKKPASAAAPPEVVRLRPEKDTLGRLMQAAPVVLLALGDAPPPPEWLAPPPRVAGGEVARPPPPAAACGACGGGPHGPPAALASAPRVPLQPPGGWRLCAAAGPGDGVALCDARGRRRRLAVTAAGPGWVAAEAPRGVYIVPGATLALHKAVGSSEIDDDDNDGPCGDAPLLGAAARAVVAPMPQPPPAPPQQPAAGCRRRRPGVRLVPGDALVVRLSGTAPEEAAAAEAMAAEAEGAPVVEVPCEELFAGVRPGHRILLDDGRFVCDVERTLPPGGRGFLLRVAAAAAPPGGKPLRLRPGRGLNAPDTPLDAPALGPADRAALADALASVRPDCVALSFVQSPKDVADLHAALDAAGADGVAVILKIETATAFRALPSLLFAAMSRAKPFAVMLARGDLGPEVGWSRLAEVQAEVGWLAEAARAPLVYATAVLERLCATGVPSRAEVTDAACASRAECVLLNKGAFAREALELLADIVHRTHSHERKRMGLLRRLRFGR